MTVFQILARYYPETLFKLKKIFPEMVAFSKKVPVIPWKEEYNIADKNPEVIETLQTLEDLLSKNLITEEEFREKSSKLLENENFASRTEGIAFIEEGLVSFRDEKPSLRVILHELGHVYFQEPDLYWNATFGGGETLLFLALKEKFLIKEEQIITYMTYLKKAYTSPSDIGKELANTLHQKLPFIDCVPHLYAYMLFAGVIPAKDVINNTELTILEPTSQEILSIPYNTQGVVSFLINMIEGLKFNDPFFITYASALEIIEKTQE